MNLTSATRLFAVIGDPVAHSLSPVMHNVAFQATGYPGAYLAFRVRSLPEALAGMRALDIGGFSVTIPHKTAVMPFLDEIDDHAAAIGAVNTVTNRDGRLHGCNTDCAGALAALRTVIEPAGRRAAVLGAGGAARALAFGLKAVGSDVTIYNRGKDRGERLAADLGLAFFPLEAFDGRRHDLVVNTTSLGMHPHVGDLPVSSERLTPDLVVMDMVYRPLHTLFLKAAEARGCRTISGLEMFVRQGALQFELWTPFKAPLELMRRAVLSALEDNDPSVRRQGKKT